MNARQFRRAALGAAAALALAACPNPVTDLTVNQVSDRSAPVVSFNSPPEGSAYTQTVTVQGTAADAGRLKGIAWAVTGTLGTLASGSLPPAGLGPGGSFSFSFGTLDFSGPIAVSVQATDWNDNVGSAVRTLASPGSALSSFTVTPGNRSVQLGWDEVAGAAYTLYYTTNGSLPSEGYGQQAAVSWPPQPLTGLANGSMHVFLLKATAGGRDYWSDYTRAIPLAGTTLAPTARGISGGVQLEWKPIPATGAFEVLRSTQRETGYTNISGTLTGTTFTDEDVAAGGRYFYKVRPALAGSGASAPVGGEPSPFVPAAQRRVGFSLPLSSQLNDVAVSGTWAFGANLQRGLQVYDIADPAHPRLVAEAGVEGNSSWGIGVNAAATIAYVSGGPYVYAFDISTPSSPQYLARSVSVGAQTYGITVRGTDVFVAAGSAGGIKFAAGNLAAIAGTFNTVGAGGGGAYGIASDANYVYIAAEAKTFVAYPVSFTLAGSMSATRAMGVAVASRGAATYAYVADETASTLRVFDVTNPAAIGILGTLSLPGISPRGIAVRWPTVVLAGMYSVGSTALRAVNVADPATPRLLFALGLPSGAERVAAAGDHAWVADMTLGLQVVNIASPSAPVAQPTAPALASAYTAAVDGTIAVGTSSSTLRVFDITSPAAPQYLGPAYATAGSAYGVALRWPHAYLAEFGKFEIVDISPALQGLVPERKSAMNLIGWGNDVALSGDFALVANASNSVDVIDVSDPVSPAVVGNILAPSSVQAVAARGNTGYAVTFGSPLTVLVFSVSNPAQPQLLASVAPALGAGNVDAMALSGDCLYLSHRNGSGTGYGLAIIDVSNPSAPVLRNTGSLGFDSRTVEVVGDYALVAPMSGSTFRVFDVSDKTSPRLVGTITQQATAIRASGNYAFLANFSGGNFTSLKLW